MRGRKGEGGGEGGEGGGVVASGLLRRDSNIQIK